jgi:hypothetical protein
MTRKRYFLLGGILTAVTLAALLILGNRPVVRAAEGDQVEYTFGRPVEKGEQSYDWYRKSMPMRQQSATALIPTRSAMVWTLGIGGPALITRCGGARRPSLPPEKSIAR